MLGALVFGLVGDPAIGRSVLRGELLVRLKLAGGLSIGLFEMRGRLDLAVAHGFERRGRQDVPGLTSGTSGVSRPRADLALVVRANPESLLSCGRR